jgi:hypothetical protein
VAAAPGRQGSLAATELLLAAHAAASPGSQRRDPQQRSLLERSLGIAAIVLYRLLDPKPSARQPALAGPRDGVHQGFDVAGVGHGAEEAQPAIGAGGVDPIRTKVALRYQDSIRRQATPTSPRARSGRRASSQRRRHGTVSTHCRIATRGSTRSIHDAARSAIRRPPHEGQNPRVLQENSTSRWCSQLPQRSHAKPSAGSPQAKVRSNSRTTWPGRVRSTWASASSSAA